MVPHVAAPTERRASGMLFPLDRSLRDGRPLSFATTAFMLPCSRPLGRQLPRPVPRQRVQPRAAPAAIRPGIARRAPAPLGRRWRPRGIYATPYATIRVGPVMDSLQPWATCLLTETLIHHLESRYPEVAARVDLRKVLHAAGFIHDFPNPREFLLDSNNWVPHNVLRDLIRSCELATGAKQFSYEAVLSHYEAARRSPPTLLETIAMMLDDVETVLNSATHWATAYTNYLQLQPFRRPEEPGTLYMLSRFRDPVAPLYGNIRFVQGSIEGIAKLYAQVETISCDELFSQLKLVSLISEFGERYETTTRGNRLRVVDRSTGQVVLIARPVALHVEQARSPERAGVISGTEEEHWVVRPDDDGGMSVLMPPDGGPERTGPASATQTSATVRRIDQPGTLKAGALELAIPEGAIFDAPYSLYRIRWRKHEIAQRDTGTSGLAAARPNSEAFAGLLFEHLKNFQSTQRRTLRMIMRNVELAQENVQLKEELSAARETGGMIGNSQAIQDLLSLIRTVAPSDATVLITGETGTGKELAAWLIHQLSRRKDRRFVAVNCGAVPETLLESEIFGHERGAFTGAVVQKKGKFELADGGTLFLDEVGDIPLPVQVKLLRILQEKEFQRVGGTSDLKANVRMIAATNRDLEQMIEQKQFRRDLYYRLNVIQIYIAPLRERTDDVPELAGHFVKQFTERAGKSLKGLTPEAIELCLTYTWPGNILELENVMERAVTLAPEQTQWITPDLLPPAIRQSAVQEVPAMDVTEFMNRLDWSVLRLALRKGGSLSGLLHQVEWAITSRAVVEYGGNKSRAARVLGRTYRWLRKLEAEMEESEPSPPRHDSPH
ncbi:MAG: hypothetical protein E8D45_06385 [Nitrospira sp.]|nr:MAG: hypothetical protein E8D45_06385 [Nitrospira sp.]